MQAPGQVRRGTGEGSEGSGEGLGGLGAEPGQVQQGTGEGSGEGSAKPGLASSGSTGFRRRFLPDKVWESLVQSQVRFSARQVRFNGFRSRLQRRSRRRFWESLGQV